MGTFQAELTALARPFGFIYDKAHTIYLNVEEIIPTTYVSRSYSIITLSTNIPSSTYYRWPEGPWILYKDPFEIKNGEIFEYYSVESTKQGIEEVRTYDAEILEPVSTLIEVDQFNLTFNVDAKIALSSIVSIPSFCIDLKNSNIRSTIQDMTESEGYLRALNGSKIVLKDIYGNTLLIKTKTTNGWQ